MRRAAVLVAALVVAGCSESVRNRVGFWWSDLRGGYSVEERLTQYGPGVVQRMQWYFGNAGVTYPPREVAFLAFKDRGDVELYGRNDPAATWRFIKRYPVHAASGHLGPKLVEGDAQVPEGIYSVALLNPNSRYHVSLRVSYPNEFDLQMAAADGRDRLGGDIMIHGDHRSIGCLAMGNEVAEELFVLAALAATQPPQIIIAPTDFRISESGALPGEPIWTPVLYGALRRALQEFPPPK
jgi:hypothetical protein